VISCYSEGAQRPKNLTRVELNEVKGLTSQQDSTKREFLDEWVRAVNTHSGFGKWQWVVSTHPSDVAGILQTSIAA
jgi:hypothetical protein